MTPRLLLLTFFLGISAFAQTTFAPSPALTLATPATLVDVQLTGSASWHLGSDNDKGTITLKARPDGKSRIDLQLPSGTRSEVHVNDVRDPHTYFNDGSSWKESAVHNSWPDANWFFPMFSAAANGSERAFALSSIGTNKVRAQFTAAGQKASATKLIEVLSTTDFTLDPGSGLPVSMRWSTHPDDNFNVSVAVEVRYSDYRDVNGVKVPFHIQRFLNGSLQLDITISSVVFNPGVPASDFKPVMN